MLPPMGLTAAPKPMPVASAPLLALPVVSVLFGEPFGPESKSNVTGRPALGLPVRLLALVSPGSDAGMFVLLWGRWRRWRTLRVVAGAEQTRRHHVLCVCARRDLAGQHGDVHRRGGLFGLVLQHADRFLLVRVRCACLHLALELLLLDGWQGRGHVLNRADVERVRCCHRHLLEKNRKRRSWQRSR